MVLVVFAIVGRELHSVVNLTSGRGVHDIAVVSGIPGHMDRVVQIFRVDDERAVFVRQPLSVVAPLNLDPQFALTGSGQLIDLLQTHPEISGVNSKAILVARPRKIEIDTAVHSLLENDPAIDGIYYGWIGKGRNQDVVGPVFGNKI